ncbi:hypothetical protein E2986_11401, partial [Frieseomelitta varia]
ATDPSVQRVRGRARPVNNKEHTRERRYVPSSASERNGRAFAIAFTRSGTRESYLHLGEGRCSSHGVDDTRGTRAAAAAAAAAGAHTAELSSKLGEARWVSMSVQALGHNLIHRFCECSSFCWLSRSSPWRIGHGSERSCREMRFLAFEELSQGNWLDADLGAFEAPFMDRQHGTLTYWPFRVRDHRDRGSRCQKCCKSEFFTFFKSIDIKFQPISL